MFFNMCAPMFGNPPPTDELQWSLKLQPHARGEFSMAVVQANQILEDQCEVFTSDAITVVGVYDGHGGYDAARFVNERLINHFLTLANGEGNMEAKIRNAFRDIEAEFLGLARQNANANPNTRKWQEIGSCCIMGVILDGMLYVANLGDSRAVMGTRFDHMPIEAQRLTIDQNVNNMAHRNDFLDLHSGEVDAVKFERGSHRVKGCIQVTKSIGDFHLKRNSMKRDTIVFRTPMLSAVPIVTETHLSVRNKFVIFASDGFWEFISDEAAVKIVHKNKRSGIAERLIKAALEAAARRDDTTYAALVQRERGTRREDHDDISVVVLFFDQRARTGVIEGSVRPPLDIYTSNHRA